LESTATALWFPVKASWLRMKVSRPLRNGSRLSIFLSAMRIGGPTAKFYSRLPASAKASAAILFDETIHQRDGDGRPMAELLGKQGITTIEALHDLFPAEIGQRDGSFVNLDARYATGSPNLGCSAGA
jgi:hypothetical protein